MVFLAESYTDHVLTREISKIQSLHGPEYWNFSDNSKRIGVHSLISYPAMMVPSLQGRIIDLVSQQQNISTVLDPYVGSGTVMTEAMLRNIDFTGIDINPLAILACKVKSGPYYTQALKKKYQKLLSKIEAHQNNVKVRDFFGVQKWYNKKTACELEKLSQCIASEDALWARRVFWLALGKTARIVSNSRSSTYKLHKKSEQSLNLYIDATNVFVRQFQLTFQALERQKQVFKENSQFVMSRYTGVVDTLLGDTKEVLSSIDKRFDLMMTSPPYGDNRTTIPYGQFSYLPLNWIDLDDIHPTVNHEIIQNTQSIDSSSLGGSLKNVAHKIEYLCDNFTEAKKFIEKLAANESGKKKFAAFFFDLDVNVELLCKSTSQGGIHSWTVANRRIDNRLVPMNKLLMEMLLARSVIPMTSIYREIKNKKMAIRNNIAKTMATETIILAMKNE